MTNNDDGGDLSIVDILGDLHISEPEDSTHQLTQLVPHQAQQEDPCKMPQNDRNANCDGESGNSSSSVIIVDSDGSSLVSYIDPAISISTYLTEDNSGADDVLAITIEETESEEADAKGPGTSTDSASSGAAMDTAKSSKPKSKTALKRCLSYSLSDDDSQTKKWKFDAISGGDMEAPGTSKVGLKRALPFSPGKEVPMKKFMDEKTASASTPKIVTRSGRRVRVCQDKTFDYSSSQLDDEEEQATQLSDNDDEEYQLKATIDESNWSRKKRRRSNPESSTSSSNSCFTQIDPSIIYLDLGQPVASITYEPHEALVLDNDDDLKTKMLKFLGLIPRRRKLYNPADHLDEPHWLITTSPPRPGSESQLNQQIGSTPIPTAPSLNASHIQHMSRKECEIKMIDDTMLLVNASTLETETPDHIKASIDLSELPSEKMRANICRRHKSCIACLEEHPLIYNFTDSLNPRTSIKMCHPMALTYRQSKFENCKQALAKLLFNIFNHTIFHCALPTNILWKRSLGKACLCEMIIDAAGQRSVRLLLWENIKHPGMLVKPILHEMCHAAAFLFNRETGHGEICRKWGYQANHRLMELPLIENCNARFKYVCSMCSRGSYGLMEFADVKELLRCHYCQFEVVVEPWSVDDVYNCIRPNTTMTEFKTYIFDRYQKLEQHETHSAKMRILNEEYLEMKIRAACD